MPRSLFATASLAIPVAGILWFAVRDEEFQDSARRPLPSELVRRTEGLSSTDPEVRREAEQDLLRFGTAGVERMAAALAPEGFAAEDRPTVVRLRDRLERLVVESESGATPVTTPGAVETMADAVRFLGRGGNNVRLVPAQELRPVRLGFDATPFWQAVDDAARRAGLIPDGVRDTGGTTVLTFRARSVADERIVVGYAGPFRLTAAVEPATGDEESRRSVRIRLGVTGEPRMRPLRVTCGDEGFTLTSSDGEAVAVARGAREAEFAWGGADGAAWLALDASLPAEEPPLTLAGRLEVIAVTATEWFSFRLDEPADAVQSRHGVEARLVDARLGGEGTEFEIAFRLPDGTSLLFESDTLRCDHTAAAAYHAQSPDASVNVSLPATSQAAGREGEIRVRYRFEGLPEAPAYVALVCRVPRRVVRLPVSVELPGLRVP